MCDSNYWFSTTQSGRGGDYQPGVGKFQVISLWGRKKMRERGCSEFAILRSVPFGCITDFRMPATMVGR